MDVERLIERLCEIAGGRNHTDIADDLREAALTLAKLQAERDEAREALRRLNERKAMYDRSSRNQADAYYNLIKGADADWLAASRAGVGE